MLRAASLSSRIGGRGLPYNHAHARSFATSPMPFRPGYGLGSWLPPGLLEGMKIEAQARSHITLYNQLDGDLESTERELLMEQNQMVNQQDASQTLPQLVGMPQFIARIAKKRQEVVKHKVDAYMKLFDIQEKLMGLASTPGKEAVSFTSFATSIESPVDFGKSKISAQDRAFDSISINASFIDTDTDSNSAASSAATVSAAVQHTKSGWFGNSWSGQLATAASHSMTRTAQAHDIESTLLITCFATHRKVQQFVPLVTDCDLLLKAWNYYVPDQPMQLDTISATDYLQASDKDAPKIYLLTEVYMGSCLVGMVHFLKNSSTETDQESSARSTKAMASFRKSMLFASLSGESGISTQFADKMANSLSSTGLNVKFDLLSLGYIPTLKSNVIQEAVKEFANFDPAKFAADSDTTLFPDMTGVQNTLVGDAKSQTAKQSNTGAVIKATLMGLQDTTARNVNVLDFTTFMNAFDDYAKNAPTKDGVGVPVGMNVRMYNKRDIIGELAKKYFDQSGMNGPQSTAANSSASSSSTAAPAPAAAPSGDGGSGATGGDGGSGGGDGGSGGGDGGGDGS